MTKGEYITIRGVLNYAKILGKARPHTGLPKYDKGPYWSLNISPDKRSMKLLEAHGLTKGGINGTGKLKKPNPNDKNRVGNDLYLDLRILENRPDGTKSYPPIVKDVQGRDWDQNALIGNGSIADVKVKIVDYGKASEKGVYYQAARILSHVPFEVETFEPLSEDDEFFGATNEVEVETEADVNTGDTASAVFDTDLDDDVPF